jgi:hypothetical protein
VLGVSGAGANGAGGGVSGVAANGAVPIGPVIASSGSVAVVAAAPACPAGTSAAVAAPEDDQLVVRGRIAYVTDRLTGEVDRAGIVVIRRGRLVVEAQPPEPSPARSAVARCRPSCPAAEDDADDSLSRAASGRWVVVDRAAHVVEPDDSVVIVNGHRVVRELLDTTRGTNGWSCCVTATTTAGARGSARPAVGSGAAGAGGAGGMTLAEIVGVALAAFALLGLGALARGVWERRYPAARPGW